MSGVKGQRAGFIWSFWLFCVCASGREWSDWSSELRIPGDELKWKFTSDGSVNGWGWRFTVYPIMPAAGETCPEVILLWMHLQTRLVSLTPLSYHPLPIRPQRPAVGPLHPVLPLHGPGHLPAGLQAQLCLQQEYRAPSGCFPGRLRSA